MSATQNKNGLIAGLTFVALVALVAMATVYNRQPAPSIERLSEH